MPEPTPLPAPRRVLIPLGIGIAVSLLGDSTLYTVLPDPEIASQAGLTLAMVGILLGVNRIVRLFFNGAAGMLIDRFSRRSLLIGSLCTGALSTAIFAFGKGFNTTVAGGIFVQHYRVVAPLFESRRELITRGLDMRCREKTPVSEQ